MGDLRSPWTPKVIFIQLSSDTDTSNFDKFEETEPFYPQELKRKKSRKDSNFIGYTFKKDESNHRLNLVNALHQLDAVRTPGVRKASAPVKFMSSNSNNF